MGASAKERKAKKAAAQQYYNEFAKLQSIPDIGSVATNNKRSVEEGIGDNASARTRNMAQKADRMARSINNDKQYKSNVNMYNDRYKILKEQIANRDSVRYSVKDTPTIEIKQTIGFNGIGGTDRTVGGIAGFGSGLGEAINPTKGGQYVNAASKGVKSGLIQSGYARQQVIDDPNANLNKLYQSKDEVMADAAKRMQEYNAMVDAESKKPNRTTGYNFIGNTTPQLQKATDANQFIQENKFGQFGVLYRNLGAAEDAVKDIQELGKRVTNSAGNQMLTKYSALAEKLKPMVKRDARNAQPSTNGQSIVSNELASANPYTETIS